MPRRRTRTPRWRAAAFAGLALFAAWWWLARGERHYWPRDQILAAIRFVESSGRDNPPDGDGGLAIGPYQIHRVYWLDAVAFRPDLGGDYQDCRRRPYAEQVLAAYMQKWAPDAWSRGEAQRIARVHNGGPRGYQNPNTLPYWHRVRARLP